MNTFSKIGISALLSLLTLSTASAMNAQPEEDTESTNDSINQNIFDELVDEFNVILDNFPINQNNSMNENIPEKNPSENDPSENDPSEKNPSENDPSENDLSEDDLSEDLQKCLQQAIQEGKVSDTVKEAIKKGDLNNILKQTLQENNSELLKIIKPYLSKGEIDELFKKTSQINQVSELFFVKNESLVQAIHEQNLEAVKKLKDSTEIYPLCSAIFVALDTDNVEIFADLYETSLQRRDLFEKYFPLNYDILFYTAAESNKPKVLQYLINSDFMNTDFISIANGNSSYLLYLAAEKGHLDIIKMLTENVNINLILNNDQDSFYNNYYLLKALAVAIKNKKDDTIEFLLKKYNKHNEALLQSIELGELNIVKYIMRNATEDQLKAALGLAFELDKGILVAAISDYIGINFDPFFDFDAQVEDAVIQNKFNVFYTLLDTSFLEDVRYDGDENRFPNIFFKAIVNGSLDIIKILYDQFTLSEFFDNEDYLSESLIEASNYGYKNVIEYLMKKNNEYYKSSNAIGKSMYYTINQNDQNDEIKSTLNFLGKHATLKDIGDILIEAHNDNYSFFNKYIKDNNSNIKNLSPILRNIYNIILQNTQNAPNDLNLQKCCMEITRYIGLSPELKNLFLDQIETLNQEINQLSFILKNIKENNKAYINELNYIWGLINKCDLENPNFQEIVFNGTILNEIHDHLNYIQEQIKDLANTVEKNALDSNLYGDIQLKNQDITKNIEKVKQNIQNEQLISDGFFQQMNYLKSIISEDLTGQAPIQ